MKMNAPTATRKLNKLSTCFAGSPVLKVITQPYIQALSRLPASTRSGDLYQFATFSPQTQDEGNTYLKRAAPLNQSTVGSRDINVDEGAARFREIHCRRAVSLLRLPEGASRSTPVVQSTCWQRYSLQQLPSVEKFQKLKA